ncbi:4-hydroxythreonine-4-phosphate dehydrogenase PdxA [Oleidesulfovibrio alaskensis]|uniref:4-hydroxythreonine-4-phosphate dehydrogenase PdxA n=1 Tax=Oleidesulfovibrio alaskensis TaxID=58180 RepID=UPI001D3B11D5|nr:4-hydroxythreonine-4-phosphate dehydrogenase PdxA [Oleidesulfovibrio alaskensis]MBG0772148.1 4-hydroxythreonine-4-phosphate dehydrogenase PdxA [Oleidesulfovibrio alaskensis]
MLGIRKQDPLKDVAAARCPLLVTMGDVNGLGPELACRVLGADGGRGALRYGVASPVVLLGSGKALDTFMTLCGINGRFWTAAADRQQLAALLEKARPGQVLLYEPPGMETVTVTPGKATADGGRAAGLALQEACSMLNDGAATGVVTLPLHKAMLQQAGFDFPGHTEFLARHAGLRDEDVCMHLCGDVLRVSLVTTHPALRDVPRLVTRQRVARCIALTVEFVRALGAGHKPVAVCGLNPHAGESGKIGVEDESIIAPAVREAKRMGLNAEGPYPADTIFYRAAQGEFAAVLAMYHDQGLAPLKLLHFSDAVNVTLGLPFVRTSVDHGTGFDIAGRNTADTGSFESALRLAADMCARRCVNVSGN